LKKISIKFRMKKKELSKINFYLNNYKLLKIMRILLQSFNGKANSMPTLRIVFKLMKTVKICLTLTDVNMY
jgi:hypothetical protein